MFPRRRWMRRWGYGYGRNYYWRRRPFFGCLPGCCLGFLLPGLLLTGLVLAAFLHYI